MSAEEQVKKLQVRGLIITDPKVAVQFFENNSYYRFSAYTYIFEDPIDILYERSHSFKPNKISFEKIKRYYDFDHKLRELTSHALRHIEVGIRTRICLELALVHKDGHFYINPTHFRSAQRHNSFLSKCYAETVRSKEIFIKHYKKKYKSPELPPLWMMIEILTFGQISMFFGNLITVNQKTISSKLDLSPKTLESWLACLSYTRNLCAHHSRLWNRKFTKKPENIEKLPNTTIGSYAQVASVIKYLMDKVEPDFPFVAMLKSLFEDYSEIKIRDLGFIQTGLAHEFWSD